MLALTIAATVQISVLGSFHPTQLELQPAKGMILMVESDGRKETVQSGRTITLTGPASISGRNGAMVRFRLAVPGVASREYVGRLKVRSLGTELQALVEMDRETAVASIADAEGTPGMPFEARKAQAIVTRSYLAGAHNRHSGYDFCDAEHCQLMKGIPHETSDAARATALTRGQVVTYKGDVVPTLYSASCGGHTKTLAQSKWMGAAIPQPGYPYFSVSCPLQGRAKGHGVGMCQLGSMEIAKHGYSAQIILSHYFPNTVIETQETGTRKAASAAIPSKVAPAAIPTTAPKIAPVRPPVRTLAINAGMGARVAP